MSRRFARGDTAPPRSPRGSVCDLPLFVGALSIVATFPMARFFESTPFMIFVIGLTLAIVSFWLVARAMGAWRRARRGTAGFRIALAIVGIVCSLFGWAFTSIIASDTRL